MSPISLFLCKRHVRQAVADPELVLTDDAWRAIEIVFVKAGRPPPDRALARLIAMPGTDIARIEATAKAAARRGLQ